MNAYFLLLLKILISFAASLLVLQAIASALLRTLEHICPDAQSARFWLSYTRIMLVIAPLVLVLLIDMISRNADPLDSLRETALAALGGLLIGMHLLGKQMGRFIRQPATMENAR